MRTSFLAVCFGAGWLLFPPGAPGATPLRVGLYQNPPKVGWSDEGTPEGVFVDVLEAVAEDAEWTLTYEPGTWGEGLDRLAAGEIDLMPDVARTPARVERFVFHQEPVLSDWFQVYARSGSGIRSLMDLDGRRVAVLERSVQQEMFSALVQDFDVQVHLWPVPDYARAFAAVADGTVDALITNRYSGARLAKTYRLEDTAIVFHPTRLYFALSKKANPEWADVIDARLARFKQNPTSVYYRSLQRWTSEEVKTGLPSWIKGVGLSVLVLLAVSFFWSVTLRHKVALRTRDLTRRHAQLQAMYEEKEQVEKALRESEIRYRSLFEFANDAILLMDPEHFCDCNLRALTLFGCSREDLLGAPPHRFSPPNQPDGRLSEEKAREEIAAAVNDGARFFEWEHCRLDGTPFSAEVSLNRLNLGSQTLVQAIVRDVTERKRNERALRELNAGLERRVAERTRELAVARDQAEAADRLKSAFLASMSHELRTPLNSILGFSGVLLQGLAGPLTEEQRKQMGIVSKSANHLLALINDVLDISKIEAGQLTVAREPFDIRVSLAKTVDLVRPLAEKKNLSLNMECDSAIGRMESDPRRVEQILLNLLNNAVKFTERGSVTLRARRADGEVCVSVTDTGIGIKPGDMNQLFQPFRQIETGLSRFHEGTGLGLAICRRLAHLLGGEIHAESVEGEGSTFTFCLPGKGGNSV